MGKKFRRYQFYKHENCVDAFFYVEKISFDENGTHAIVHGNWMIQGMFSFWFGSDRVRLNIKPDQYDKWKSYNPKGEMHV